MDRAPLPPHERPWRHPSELGPPEHEPTSTRGRVLIVTTATLSLLLVGALALSMTPGQGPGPIAVGSTTAEASTRPAALEQPGLPMVTPLGDEGYGVTTAGAAGGSRARMAARLPSGAVVDVYIVRRDEASGVTLVSLPTRTSGYELAASRPAPSDTVVVQAREPIVVAMVDIAGLDVAEGTPVLDDQGDLVGLCTWDADTITVMTVSTMPGAEPASTTSAPRTTVVTTTVLVTVPPTTPSTTALPAATTTAPATTTATTSVTSTTVPSTSAGPGVNGGVASTTAPG